MEGESSKGEEMGATLNMLVPGEAEVSDALLPYDHTESKNTSRHTNQPKEAKPSPNDMSHASFQIRRRRRLPHVQRPSRSRPPGTFWLTYSRAVDWLRRNHGIIDKTLELLEIYPTLIQEMSLDGLWDFLAPYLTPLVNKSSVDRLTTVKTRPPFLPDRLVDTTTTTTATTTLRPTSQSNTSISGASPAFNNRGITSSSSSSISRRSPRGTLPTNSETLQVPVISITYASDDEEPELQALSPGPLLGCGDSFGLAHRTPRVYLCCLCEHLGGEEQLHRHVMHALQHDFYVRSGPCSEESSVLYWDDLSEADLCVFLLDDLSLNTLTCFKGLCAAHALNMPIVFLKDCQYSLPVPLPDIILQHNLGLESPELSRASTPVGPRRSSAASEASHHHAAACPSPAAAGRASSSFSTPGCREERSQRRAKQNLQDTDMVLCLLNGYRDALVFEEARHQDCEKELRDTVHRLLESGRQDSFSSRNGSVTQASKTPNTLRPFSRKSDRTKRMHRTSHLGSAPRAQVDDFRQQDSGVSGMSSYTSDDDSDFSFANTPSDLAIDLPCEANGSSNSSNNATPGTLLSPHHHPPPPPLHHHLQRTTTSTTSSQSCNPRSQSGSPPPERASSVGGFPSSAHSFPSSPSPSVTPVSRSGSSRSFLHLHHFQQQLLQQDRAHFLSSVSPISDNTGDVWAADTFQERQTVYLVCDKPKREPPRLVKFPPSTGEEEEGKEKGKEKEEEEKEEEEKRRELMEMLSDASADSPVSFRSVDLSAVVDKPMRGIDTPDSDASTLF